MRPILILAIALIALGIAAFTYQGISYSSRDKVADLGPVQISTTRTHTIPLPPIVGAIAIVGGIGLLFFGNKQD